MNHNIIIMNTTRDLVTHHFYIIHRTYCVLALNHTLLYMILLREEMLNMYMHCRTELRKQVDPRFLYTTDILLVAALLPALLSFCGKAYINVVVMHMRAMRCCVRSKVKCNIPAFSHLLRDYIYSRSPEEVYVGHD